MAGAAVWQIRVGSLPRTTSAAHSVDDVGHGGLLAVGSLLGKWCGPPIEPH
jgi:hypothetical protein